jgi:hypothetical protein
MSSTASAERTSVGWGPAILRSLACLSAFALVYGAAVLTPLGQRVDTGLMGGGFHPLPRPVELLQLVRKGSPIILAVVGTVSAIGALRRRQWGLVLRCAALCCISFAAARLMRWWLPRPDFGDLTYPANTWPSGHVAASAALVVAALALAPPNWQTLTVRRVGALVLLATASASIATLAHRPSDVIASMLLVAGLTAVLFPAGVVGWRALRRDVVPALASALAAVCFSLVPWFREFALLVNGAWMVAAVLLTIGWRGAAPATAVQGVGRSDR